LFPIYPLDGGRLMTAIGASINSGFLSYVRLTTWHVFGATIILFRFALFCCFGLRINKNDKVGLRWAAEALFYQLLLILVFLFLSFLCLKRSRKKYLATKKVGCFLARFT